MLIECFAVTIAERVWNELGSRDIRDVMKVGRLADSIEVVSFIVNIMKRKITKQRES
jgi:hypothetical protein